MGAQMVLSQNLLEGQVVDCGGCNQLCTFFDENVGLQEEKEQWLLQSPLKQLSLIPSLSRWSFV